MTFTTDCKPCGCSRGEGAPKCATCAPRARPRRTVDRAPAKAKAIHINVDEILTMMRAHLRTRGRR